MNPLDTEDRIPELKKEFGIGYCNITKCCTKVCPEHITITDNAIIPLKERVVDEFYDPVLKLVQLVFRPRKKEELTESKPHDVDRGQTRGASCSNSSRCTREAIPAALEKAHRYRLLNEPEQAESICEDVLRIDPENQERARDADPGAHRPVRTARGRFRRGACANCSPRLHGEYERAYYAGIIAEREGIAWLRSGQAAVRARRRTSASARR